MCTKLKRVFAGVFSVCLIFSVCLQGCLVNASAAPSSSPYSVTFMGPGDDNTGNTGGFDLPLTNRVVINKTNHNHVVPGTTIKINIQSAGVIAEPFDHTLYWYCYPACRVSGDIVNHPFDYIGGDGIQHVFLGSNGGAYYDAGTVRNWWRAENGRGWACRATIPKTANCWQIRPLGSASPAWQMGSFGSGEAGTLNFVVDFFDIVDSADPDVLEQLDKILSYLGHMSGDLHNIFVTTNSILAQCKDLNISAVNILQALNNLLTELKKQGVDLKTIKSLLDGWTGSDGVYHPGIYRYIAENLPKLKNIDSNVAAIYYVLAKALKDESANMDSATQGAVDQIQSQHAQNEYWQTNAQTAFDDLHIADTNFGAVTGGISLVGKIFSQIFDTLGSYSIILTFPLILGIALLIIGRIGRSSRYNHNEKDGDG